jgi:hypothetical protein
MTPEVIEDAGASLTLYPDGPDWEGSRMATIGKFRFGDADKGAALIRRACDRARASGAQGVIGPMEGDTWHSYRLVSDSDGSKPFLMEPTSAPAHAKALTSAGFAVIGRYLSARVSVSDALGDAPEPGPLSVAHWDGTDPEALFTQVHELSVAAFARNAFYKPIARAEFLAMYMPVVPLMLPDLIWFARRADGSLAGFLFGIPNYAEGPKPASVILKTYASLEKGAGHRLSHAFHAAADARGYGEVIHALIHEDNLSAIRSRGHGAEVFRRYALMGRRFDAASD